MLVSLNDEVERHDDTVWLTAAGQRYESPERGNTLAQGEASEPWVIKGRNSEALKGRKMTCGGTFRRGGCVGVEVLPSAVGVNRNNNDTQATGIWFNKES